MTADEPGCYVHYLPCHGPNVYDRTSVDTAGNSTIVDKVFLKALKAPSVVEMASQFGDPINLLENWPD